MSRAGTFFTLDIYESATVANALRDRSAVLRRELRHKHNTPSVSEHLSLELAHCEEVSERLRARFAKARRAFEAVTKGATDAR